MGGKRKRRRQYVLLFAAVCLTFSLLMTGCRSALEPVIPDPYTPIDRQEARMLDQAASYLQQGNPDAAVQSVKKAIACCNGRFGDRALHLLVTAMTDPRHPTRGATHTIRCFQLMEAGYPGGLKGPAARCWAAALIEISDQQAEIQQLKMTIQLQKHKIQTLSKQIEQMKAVDLEPTPPTPGDNISHE